jgi:hypothetical protein
MNITSTEQAKGGVQVVQQTNTEFGATTDLASNFVRAAQPGPRHVGYGLPCSRCGTYYLADQSICPICKCRERISPITLPAQAGLNAQSLPDADELEEEREPFPEEIQVTAILHSPADQYGGQFPLQPGREPSGWPRTSSDLQILL